jgi:hypothetical protein
MTYAVLRGQGVRVAIIVIAASCLGIAAFAQTNAPPVTNAPPAATGGAARQGGTSTPPATGAPAAPPAATAPASPPAAAATPAAPASPPAAAAAATVRACPANAQEMHEPTDCVCTAASVAVEANAPVWGSDIYTDDSNICRAARHAGVIPQGGGTVRVTPRGAQQSYVGAARNGIASQNYGAYEHSFSVAASDAKSDVDLNQCPASFEAYRGRTDAFTCVCTAAQMAEGNVWGTDVYTDDSNICRAAAHAGAVRGTGGSVTLRGVPPRQSYAGSTRNGVVSQNFGQFEGAYSFDTNK